MERLFISIFQMSISASYLILAVLIVRFLLRKAPKSMRSFLWLLVGIRLLVPFSVESVFSLIPSTRTVNEYIYDIGLSEINTITKEAANTNLPISQPVQNAAVSSVPSTGESADKIQGAISFCSRAWCTGVILMLSYMFISWLCLKNRVRMSIPADMTLECGHVRIYWSDAVESPFLFGIINPRIYIPSHIADKELPYVVLHEITHQKRRDYLIKPVGFLLLSVYWFNPCAWIAYVMLCKDIELICDEKVIRQLGVSHKKEYSQALLNGAVNRRMITACPVAFGEVSVKERVKNVLNYKKPAFWALVAAVLACIIVPVCFMTHKKTDPSEKADAQGEIHSENLGTEEINLDDVFSMAGEYEMLNPDPEQYLAVPRLRLEKDGTFSFTYNMLSSYLPYGGYELKGDILTAVTSDDDYYYQFKRIGDFNNSILLFDTEHSSDVTNFDVKMKLNAPIENGSVFFKNTVSAVLSDVEQGSWRFEQELYKGTTIEIEELQKKQVESEELKKRLVMEKLKLQRQMEKAEELLDEKNRALMEIRLQELAQNIEVSIQQLEEYQQVCQALINASEKAVHNTIENASEIHVAYDTVEQWARAFCDRDGAAIVRLADEKLEQKLVNDDLLLQGFDGEKDYVAFGWSSPWPWGSDYDGETTKYNYRILNVTGRSAEILYYAWVSNPHVTVWRELLTFTMKDDECLINSEELHFMDGICTAEEFRKAYPDGITGTMMDYYSYNDAGTYLNDHAVNNPADSWYGKMLKPDTAAVCLLNILDNPNKVGVQVRKAATDENSCIVNFEFYEDGNTVSVHMMRPYGSDGIWVPYTELSEVLDSDGITTLDSYQITRENIKDIIAEDAKQLEALFPDHHEFALDAAFPQTVDLNGDGASEEIEMVDLLYNGGDGGYALRVTDTKTGKQIPLPDGYTEENGFPVFSSYIEPKGEKPQLLIQLGEGNKCQTLAAIMLDPLYGIYEQKNMYREFKNAISNYSSERLAADALSGCRIITYDNEENPVILLKTYVSGFLGHIDTLGYVITELRLQKDNTWVSQHYFLLDGCRALSVAQQDSAAFKKGGAMFLPYTNGSDIDIVQLTPDR